MQINMTSSRTTHWDIFKGDRQQDADAIQALPEPPPWRDFRRQRDADPNQRVTKKERRGSTFFLSPEGDEVKMVNAALCLRRPLLVTGKPGTGKSSLAYAVAWELDLGEVLYWPITTRTTLKDGLYNYDAIGRLQDAELRGGEGGNRYRDRRRYRWSHRHQGDLSRIGKYIRLGPLGTAFLPCDRPRVLLIDEIDKSDIDLPNDLLHIFEEGEFIIPELERIAAEQPTVEVRTAYVDEQESRYAIDKTVVVTAGRIQCQEFPLVIMTSNEEREFPPAFLRRCLRLDIPQPDTERLKEIVKIQLGEVLAAEAASLMTQFKERRDRGQGDLSTDQLLNAIKLITKEKAPPDLIDKLLRYLNT